MVILILLLWVSGLCAMHEPNLVQSSPEATQSASSVWVSKSNEVSGRDNQFEEKLRQEAALLAEYNKFNPKQVQKLSKKREAELRKIQKSVEKEQRKANARILSFEDNPDDAISWGRQEKKKTGGCIIV